MFDRSGRDLETIISTRISVGSLEKYKNIEVANALEMSIGLRLSIELSPSQFIRFHTVFDGM